MGADGHLQLMHRTVWDANYPDLAPETIGLHAGTILGTDAVWRYWDTEDRDDFDNGWGAGRPAEIVTELRRIERRLARFDAPLDGDIVTGDPGTRRIDRVYDNVAPWSPMPLKEVELLADRDRIHASGADLDLGGRILDARGWYENNAQDVEVWT